MDEKKEIIAIDIGGTAIKYGLVSGEGKILFRDQRPAEAAKSGGPGILQKTLAITEQLLQKEGRERIRGVAISSAGMVDVDKGEIFYAGPTIPDFTGTKFKQEVQGRFGLPCEIENDVNCAGLAEYISGAARGAKSMVCLTVGTGIGGCAVIDGKVLHGVCGAAMEVGYMDMGDADFQSLGAASVLTHRAAHAKHESDALWDGRRVFAAAKNGDAICAGLIDDMCRTLGTGIANICYCLNPEVVVLGGGIMAQKEYLYPKIRGAMDEKLKPVIAGRTRLAFAMYENGAGMMGAYYHFCMRQDGCARP